MTAPNHHPPAASSRNPLAVHYEVRLHNPDAHIFEVRCTIADPHHDGQSFRLPSWIPGSYLIREFARNVIAVRAEAGGTSTNTSTGITTGTSTNIATSIAKTAKDTWVCAPCVGPLTVIAEIYAWDLSVRGAHFDRTHAFYNGTSLFLVPTGMEQRECVVDLVAPDTDANVGCADWRVITSLSRDGASPYGFGRYRAADYDELIDHPVEMGTFTLASFEAGGARHDVAITGRHDCDLARLTTDLQRICSTQIDFFGGGPNSRAPVDHYVFLVMALGDAFGGLEHRASTALVIARDKLPHAGMREITDDYIQFLGLASHEYFHTWNVKRIKPAAFAPYDLTCEAYTRQLWIFEGFTSYYDNLMLLRSGAITVDHYLSLIGQDITRVLRGSGRLKQSIADSSFDAWIKYYRQDENAPNALVSYYVKGSLVGMLLELHLRKNSLTSLDEVMRTLWNRHGKTGRGVPEDGVRQIAQELSGLDLADFFARYVDGTDELPLADALRAVAIELHLRAAEGNKDTGGKAGKSVSKVAKAGHNSCKPDGTDPALWLGARWTAGGDARLTHVLDDGPAQRAGLAAGDTIIAWNGLRVSAGTLHSRLTRAKAGQRTTVHAFRRDELMTFDVVAAAAPLDTCWLTLNRGAIAAAVALREAWLAGTPIES